MQLTYFAVKLGDSKFSANYVLHSFCRQEMDLISAHVDAVIVINISWDIDEKKKWHWPIVDLLFNYQSMHKEFRSQRDYA